MVIGRRFAWAHLPKTGGDATCTMSRAVPGLVLFADPINSQEKHSTFWEREDQVAGKLLVMNIRRLPQWAISLAQHQARHGEYPYYTPEPLPSADELCCSTDADDSLRWMTDHGRFEVGRWLRTEHLEEDLLSLLEDLGELTDEARSAVHAVGRVNVGDYYPNLGRLNDAHVARLYERNPEWAAIEHRVYGDLHIGRAAAPKRNHGALASPRPVL